MHIQKKKLIITLAALFAVGGSAHAADDITNTMGGEAAGDPTVNAINEAAGVVINEATVGTVADPATINGALRGTVGISAIGASATVGSTTTAENADALQQGVSNVENNGVVGTINATNRATIDNNTSGAANTITGGGIVDGASNSVNISGIGASASMQTATVVQGLNEVNNTDTGLTNRLGTLDAPNVNTRITTVNEVDADVTNVGAIVADTGGDGATVTGGVANSIGISAMGANALAGSSTLLDGQGDQASLTVTNTVDVGRITATNHAVISNDGSIEGGYINGDAISSGINITALGASGSLSNSHIGLNIDNLDAAAATTISNTLGGGNSTLTLATDSSPIVYSDADGTISDAGSLQYGGDASLAGNTLTAGPGGATVIIDGGDAVLELAGGESITFTGLVVTGADTLNFTSITLDGGVSTATLYDSGFVIGGLSFSASSGGLTITQGPLAGAIINVTNNGAVNNIGVINPDDNVPNVGISAGINNSLGVNAIGASASASNSYINDNGAAASTLLASTNNLDVASLTATNVGAIANTATINGGAIAGGIGNSVTASAVAAASSISNTVTLR